MITQVRQDVDLAGAQKPAHLRLPLVLQARRADDDVRAIGQIALRPGRVLLIVCVRSVSGMRPGRTAAYSRHLPGNRLCSAKYFRKYSRIAIAAIDCSVFPRPTSSMTSSGLPATIWSIVFTSPTSWCQRGSSGMASSVARNASPSGVHGLIEPVGSCFVLNPGIALVAESPNIAQSSSTVVFAYSSTPSFQPSSGSAAKSNSGGGSSFPVTNWCSSSVTRLTRSSVASTANASRNGLGSSVICC